MTRTDRRGRDLKTFVAAEIVGGDINIEELRAAMEMSRWRWYGDTDNPGRSDADDFPDAMELHRLAQHFHLGDDGWLNLLAEFGWLEPRTDIPGYTTGRGFNDPPILTRKAVKTADDHLGPAL